ncbi:MAG: hypothetical protein ACJAU6_001032 [Alphaproteobacteria bacterium]|jgi:hypothetical protein
MNRYFNINRLGVHHYVFLILVSGLFLSSAGFASISEDSTKLHEEAKNYLEKGNF